MSEARGEELRGEGLYIWLLIYPLEKCDAVGKKVNLGVP